MLIIAFFKSLQMERDRLFLEISASACAPPYLPLLRQIKTEKAIIQHDPFIFHQNATTSKDLDFPWRQQSRLFDVADR
ncbi:MAG TPA: hypothetical protein VKC60_01165 [Opitutaceae bacterium]|nr:hypothetical protein [Opitutaceae bacterium]